MYNFHQDQAEGLRRLMAAPKPRVMSIISASANQQPSRLMTNLGSTISASGNEVLLIEAAGHSEELRHAVRKMPALLDVANGKTLLTNAIKHSQQGFSYSKFRHDDQSETLLDPYQNQLLGFLFEDLTHEFDIVLVDTSIDVQGLLPLPILNESEILIQLSRQPESIKHAYGLIKRICSQMGTRSFSIVVDDATEAQAEPIYNNIAEVAWRFMKIQLTFFGAIPYDEHLTRAAYLGRSVVDAFPMATASTAFQKIAQRLHKGRQKARVLQPSSVI